MKKRIVIVEDDYMIQDLHRHYVEQLGHEVVACFASGREAIDYFSNNTADLILMDIRLEDGIDGIDTMKMIDQVSSIPVVYISANTDESNFRRALNSNFKGFLSKPVMQSEIEKVIDSLHELNESIYYAERIQKTLFPQRKEIASVFKNYLFINRPKQIITGDFLFLMKRRKYGDILGGVGDCTGHGIPAALLSVLSHEMLVNKAKKYGDLKSIIYNLNNNIIRNFSDDRKETRISDSLDLILFLVNKEQLILEVAGIKRPFIHYNSITKTHQYISLKGNSLGSRIEQVNDIPFCEVRYSIGDSFYFFSDGVTDQFGGPRGKKLMKKGLLNFLNQIVELPFSRKQIEIDVYLRKWQGDLEQTDDILLFGIEID